MFDGQPLRLLSIGTGYSKRLTFEPFKNCLNSNQNYFWTDSMPSGFGFELRAVPCDTTFKIYVRDQCLGYSSVFRVDYPQYEEKQLMVSSVIILCLNSSFRKPTRSTLPGLSKLRKKNYFAPNLPRNFKIELWVLSLLSLHE